MHPLMANEALVPELSWLLTLICLSVIVLLVAMCVCSKQAEKAYFQNRSHNYGTAGRLSMTRDSPIFQHPTTNGAVVSKSAEEESVEEDGSIKRNSWTVKDRALPDIPDGGGGAVPSTSGAVAADIKVVTTEENAQAKKKTHNKSTAPKPPVVEAVVVEIPPDQIVKKEQPHVMKITINDKSKETHRPSTSSTFNTRPWTQVLDSIPGTSDGSVILKKVGSPLVTDNTNSPTRRLSDSDAYNTTTNPYAEPHIDSMSLSSSPVCIRICASDNSNDHSVFVTPAGLAVAGAVPSSDIPYMTPPLLHNQPPISNEESPQRNINSLTGRSEVPYTVISVREPLARVREMTRRKQRSMQQTSNQNSVEGENHYAMVPEEEQMYAEIGSGQDSASSSITYAHIEPRELPPVPPTVESLKSVAHAHSRQASTVSNSSFGSCVSGSVESTSPTQLRNPSASLYSAVEKNNKQRRTIHVAEGASAMTNPDKHKKVEDLYARVRKKRVELTLSASSSEEYSGYQGITGDNSECMTPPPSPWASTTPPAPPPITGRLHAASLGVASTSGQNNRRHSADPNLSEVVENKPFSYSATANDPGEPGYEQIYNDDNNNDSCYEKIKDESLASSDGKVGYESIHQPEDNKFSFPGYASVKDNDKDSSDPGYECVAQMDSLSDPGYEPVRISLNLEDRNFSNHGYTTVNLDDETEPNYETVNKIYRTESDAVDPGYEKVKKLSRNDSDATDPGYERVRNNADANDPGYEEVHRSECDNEPGYEIVQHRKVLSSNGHSMLVPNNRNFTPRAHNSTVLFVSGNPLAINPVDNELISKESNSDQDSGATFL